MPPSSANQLFLLADHIKLSLLERQRAQTLHLDDDTQDGHISRSLDQFRDGLAALSTDATDAESHAALQKQFDDLTAQFHGFATPSSNATLTHPNSAALNDDFAHAASTSPPAPTSASASAMARSKTVRFSDTPPSPTDELFGPYRDDPSAGDAVVDMSNQQIHEYHSQILSEQDAQLDRLGESIGRQRELSMQIGDELDNHVAMLDEVEGLVDRHQTRLDRAGRMLKKVAKGAGENKQMTAIVVLIIILVLLIAVLK